MTSRFMKLIISSLFLVLVFTSCESEYTKLAKQESQRDYKLDSIIFDIHFGETRSDFYKRCFELNKQKLVFQGPSNSSVQHNYYDSLYHEDPTAIRILFYPITDDENIINGMNFEFSYEGWAPWNAHLQDSILKPKLVRILEDWYPGNNFIPVKLDNDEILIKLDANRRISLYEKGDSEKIIVKFHDMSHPRFKHNID